MTVSDTLSGLSHTFEVVNDFRPELGSVYVSRRSVEERSEHIDTWPVGVDVTLLNIVREEREAIWFTSAENAAEQRVALRSSRELQRFWDLIKDANVYLDITGLRHSSWAALLRGVAGRAQVLRVVYVEPNDYRMSPNPTESDFYDLSEKIDGIAPLPGFARLREEGPTSCFVPLLGFEGTRLLFMISQLEPPGQRIFPVVGVPGFRAEYPFVTYLSNRAALQETKAWRKVRFAAVDSPFEVYALLSQLRREHPNDVLKVAPIGTKPHALGAVLFALRNPSAVELVYDHPVRHTRRTVGTARLHVYSIDPAELLERDA
jgi:hypothetical protein